MSRRYDPDCELERATREAWRSVPFARDICNARAPGGSPWACSAPRHEGRAHICTARNGAIIIMRWTDSGTIQVHDTHNWQGLR